MLAFQTDFLEDNSEIGILKQELSELRKISENVRKGLFARHNELMKMYIKQQEEIDRLREMMIQTKKG